MARPLDGDRYLRTRAADFQYMPVDQLADPTQIEDIVRRFMAIEGAVLGGSDEPKTTISKAMTIYKEKIAIGELMNKSPEQKKLWHATKDRSLRYFDWWNQQLPPNDPSITPKKPKTAARHFSDVRKKILIRGALDGLTKALHLVTFMLIETGCRPGEIINLMPEDISSMRRRHI